jgi:hypothetical protein
VLRALAAVTVTTATLALAAAPPRATPPRLRVVPAIVAAGGIVSVSGTGCAGRELVTLLSSAFSPGRSKVVGELHTTARRNGSFVLRVTVPRRKPHARYAVAARCADRGLGALAWLRVV